MNCVLSRYSCFEYMLTAHTVLLGSGFWFLVSGFWFHFVGLSQTVTSAFYRTEMDPEKYVNEMSSVGGTMRPPSDGVVRWYWYMFYIFNKNHETSW